MTFANKKNAAISDESDFMQLYFDEIARTPLLSFDDEKALSMRVAQGDKAAQDALVRANLLLVVKIAKHFITKDYHLMDIIQDGNIGLIKAAERYDYKRGVRFSTYASWWIKQSIVRSLSLKKRMIRLPHRKEEKLRQLGKAWNTLNQNLGHVPSAEELADELSLEAHEVETLQSLLSPVVSFENTVADKDSGLSNVLEDYSYSPDHIVFRENFSRVIHDALDTLPEKEKEVLGERFGFEAKEKSTLKKMGDRFGISAETVRQIEVRALRKLRGKHAYLKEYLC
ncbi:MAG: RNA polymerase sigma factor RpoD/SigA [Spirochaetota bacterium]|jgi:RNA polymerase primary sigma factor|nr:RNA polymerase sigma factor RpoD/SigA [Spirochaetota bacterium]